MGCVWRVIGKIKGGFGVSKISSFDGDCFVCFFVIGY